MEDIPVKPVSDALQRLFPPGTVLGHYEVERVLGEGAYGWVLAARDSVSKTRVAIKKFKVRIVSSNLP